LNLDPRQAIELGDSLIFTIRRNRKLASMELALSVRQEWKAMESQIKAAEYQKKASQDSRLPSLRFDGDFAYVGTSGNTTLPTYTYQASVNMPLFTGGGSTRRRFGRPGNQETGTAERRSAKPDRAGREDGAAEFASARTKCKWRIWECSFRRKKWIRRATGSKRGCKHIEVIQAQDSLSRANDNQIVALYRFNQARADFAPRNRANGKGYAK